jgi:hypothetical protein
MINVDVDVSKEIGQAISKITWQPKLSPPTDPEQLEYERFIWFIHSLINHQINSTFLEQQLRTIPKERFNAEGMKAFQGGEMQELLKDYRKPERIMAEERAAMVREACEVLAEKHKTITALLEDSDFSVAKLLPNLDFCRALSEDPLRKKSNIFIQILSRNDLARFDDIDKVQPAIDYQLVRLALRNGRIKLDPGLQKKVIDQEGITEEEDRLMRDKVIEAFRIVADTGSKTVPQLNMMDWLLARSFCIRDTPLCETETNPLKDVLEFNFQNKCPLFNACEKHREYKREPLFKTSFY